MHRAIVAFVAMTLFGTWPAYATNGWACAEQYQAETTSHVQKYRINGAYLEAIDDPLSLLLGAPSVRYKIQADTNIGIVALNFRTEYVERSSGKEQVVAGSIFLLEKKTGRMRIDSVQIGEQNSSVTIGDCVA